MTGPFEYLNPFCTTARKLQNSGLARAYSTLNTLVSAIYNLNTFGAVEVMTTIVIGLIHPDVEMTVRIVERVVNILVVFI